jgi:hypothetical protein
MPIPAINGQFFEMQTPGDGRSIVASGAKGNAGDAHSAHRDPQNVGGLLSGGLLRQAGPGNDSAAVTSLNEHRRGGVDNLGQGQTPLTVTSGRRGFGIGCFNQTQTEALQFDLLGVPDVPRISCNAFQGDEQHLDSFLTSRQILDA